MEQPGARAGEAAAAEVMQVGPAETLAGPEAVERREAWAGKVASAA